MTTTGVSLLSDGVSELSSDGWLDGVLLSDWLLGRTGVPELDELDESFPERAITKIVTTAATKTTAPATNPNNHTFGTFFAGLNRSRARGISAIILGWISTGGAISAVILGAYPPGVPYPPLFWGGYPPGAPYPTVILGRIPTGGTIPVIGLIGIPTGRNVPVTGGHIPIGMRYPSPGSV